MSTRSSTSPFLALPRELRDQIYSHFILLSQPPPRTPEQSGNRIRCKGHKQAGRYYADSQSPFPERRMCHLLLLNRQIKHEVEDLTEKLIIKQIPTAELDLMVKGYRVWPTWTCIPLLPVGVGDNIPICNIPIWNICLAMRIYSTEIFRETPGRGIRCRGYSLFIDLLFEFLARGPNIYRPIPKKCRIKTLTINVEFLDIYTPSTHPPAFALLIKHLTRLAGDISLKERVQDIVLHAAVDAKSEVWKRSGVATAASIKVTSDRAPAAA